MADLIAIDPEALRAHGRAVDAVADSVDSAADAAAGIDLGGGAFGLLCSFLVLPANVASAMAISSLRGAASMLHRAAQGVDAVATEAEQTEQTIIAIVKELDAQLPAGGA